MNKDFAGCQVEYSLANVAVNVFQRSVLQLAVIFCYVGSIVVHVKSYELNEINISEALQPRRAKTD